MNTVEILRSLLKAIDDYDRTTTSRQECEFGASPELVKYWEEQNKAKEYLKKVDSPNDDLSR